MARLGLVLVVAMTATLGAGLGAPTRVSAGPDLGLPLFGVDLSTAPSADAPARAQGTGAGYVVVHVDWTELEPADPPPDAPLNADAVARLDARIADVASRGMVPVANVDGAPPWAAPHRNGPLLAGKLEAYVAFLGKVVDRYQAAPYDIRHWILWTEPDAISMPAEWPDRGAWGDNPAEFAATMRAAYDAIKQHDPGAVVILGSLAHDWFYDPGPGCPTSRPCGGSNPGFNGGGIFQYRFLDQVLDAMLANGGSPAFDALGLNTYITFAPGWEMDANRRGAPAWDVAAKIGHVRARLSLHGVDVPIFVGESGFWSAGTPAFVTDGKGSVMGRLAATPQAQAEYVAKLYARARSAGAAAVTWFALEEMSPTDKHGLVDDAGSYKPARDAFNWAAGAIGARARTMSSNGLLATSQGSIESYAFSGGSCADQSCYTVVAWAVGSASPTAVVRAAQGLQAYDLYGNPVSALGAEQGRYLYRLGSSPVFFQRSTDRSTLARFVTRRGLLG